MRKIAVLAAIAWALMGFFVFAQAEVPGDAFAEFAFKGGPGAFYSSENCCIRARYRIELPEDTSKLHAQILQAYEDKSEIQLIEFGVPGIGGILESYFVCVGMDAAGDLEQLPTPRDLLARIYDMNAFDELRVTPLTEGVGA